MNGSIGFGERLKRLRRQRKLSQKELGRRTGASQATISRLEGEEDPPGDTRLIAQLAQELGVQMNDLLAGLALPSALIEDEQESFYAFCPNPFCELNAVYKEGDGKPFVQWKSGAKHPGHVFDVINFCARCGSELVKNCPSCNKRLRSPGTRFCVTCGARVTDRPTDEEWKRIGEIAQEKSPESEIPF